MFQKINDLFRIAAGKECEVHDFVIGSATYERCQADRRFKTFVIETALDSVEAQRKCKLERSFTLPKLKFKGPGDRPPVLAVKGERLHFSIRCWVQDLVSRKVKIKRKAVRTQKI